MNRELMLYLVLISIAGLVGLSFGYASEFALLTTVLILAWQVNALESLNRWLIQSSKRPFIREHGQIYGIYRKILRKDKRRKQQKQRLSSLIKEFRNAVSALPDAIVLIDQNGKIAWANSNARNLLGIEWPLDKGVRFNDLIRDPEVEALLQNDGDASGPSKQGVEIKSRLDHEVTISLKCVNYSEQTRMVIARDVSRLIKINQIHSDFVANVSHELKTPLTVLKGYVEILSDSNAIPEQFHKPLEQMNLQSVRMQLIVNDLLYLAKLENKESASNHEPVVISHLLNTIIEAAQPLVEEKQHQLSISVDDKVALFGAATELHSAFANLITNAITYTPEGGTIDVFWEGNQDGAEFKVVDNGLGIAPHHIKRLTQRFYRIDTDRSREGGGTGLGLAIVKHVLQRHDAKLLINSEESEGSRFICRFPAEKLIIGEHDQVINLTQRASNQ